MQISFRLFVAIEVPLVATAILLSILAHHLEAG